MHSPVTHYWSILNKEDLKLRLASSTTSFGLLNEVNSCNLLLLYRTLIIDLLIVGSQQIGNRILNFDDLFNILFSIPNQSVTSNNCLNKQIEQNKEKKKSEEEEN